MPNPLFRRVALPHSFPGSLYLTSLPGYFHPVEEYIEEWARLTVGASDAYVLCLVGAAERLEKSPNYDHFLKVTKFGERWMEISNL